MLKILLLPLLLLFNSPAEATLEGAFPGKRNSLSVSGFPGGSVPRMTLKITQLTSQEASNDRGLEQKTTEPPAGPLLLLEPRKIDLGAASSGDKITGRMQIRNRGTDVLRWSVTIPTTRPLSEGEMAAAGRFLSLENKDVAGKGYYLPPNHLREQLELTGRWSEEGGYPVSLPPSATLRFRFSGTSVALLNMRKSAEGTVTLLVDEQPFELPGPPEEGGSYPEEYLIEGLHDAPHTLSLVIREARFVLQGLKTFGRESQRFPPKALAVFPRSGVTTRETDYLTLTLDAKKLPPGLYLDTLEISTNGGNETALIFVEVLPAGLTGLLDVYRLVKDREYLLSTNLQADQKKIFLNGYQNQGVAFRLFPRGTPGTLEYFRWYNPLKGDYYYSYQRQGDGKSLAGYIFEGPIGNIATSRIAGTRPLHRWYNRQTGRHFFSVDARGEDLPKQGYIYEAISGFVR